MTNRNAVPIRAARVERQRLKFAAAHMATFAHTLEPLHGHNYAVLLEAEGRLREEGWVLDFGVLKRIGRELCDSLDHHFLLQRPGRGLSVHRQEGTVALQFGERRYVFPEADVLELPIANTTAELIAEWLWTQVLDALRTAGIDSLSLLRVGVEEAPGQIGWFAAAVP